jgi:hypothetical protein
VEDTTIFALINYSGSWNGGLLSSGGTPLADGSQFSVGSQWWEIDYNSSTGGDNFTSDYLPSSSFVTVTAVPEPGTLALLGIGAGLAVLAFRRNPGRATGSRPLMRLRRAPSGKPDPSPRARVHTALAAGCTFLGVGLRGRTCGLNEADVFLECEEGPLLTS